MIKRKRIAIEVPIAMHDEIAEYCQNRGLSMTQYVIMLINEALKKDQ